MVEAGRKHSLDWSLGVGEMLLSFGPFFPGHLGDTVAPVGHLCGVCKARLCGAAL